MYTSLRAIGWLVLVVAGLSITVFTAIAAHNESAWIPVGIVVAASWYGIAILSSWFFGIKRHAKRHIGKSLDFATFVDKDIGATRMADYVRTLEHLQSKQKSRRFGMHAAVELSHLKSSNSEALLVDWSTIEGVDGELINIPSNAIYMLKHDGDPFLARASIVNRTTETFEHEEVWTTGAGQKLEIAAESLEVANRVIRWLGDQSSAHSVYRGHMLYVASPKDGSSGQTIRMAKRPASQRDRIVIPDSILSLLDRLIKTGSQFRATISKLGHSSTMGILMHGAPGTGKTLVTRTIVGELVDHTIVVPEDMEVETLRACFRLSRYLPPAVIIIEDVDLLARRRDSSQNTDGLQELMNEMDGIAPASHAIVLMSTNQPELLEPALAARPGRVSQTIEFPLPDMDARNKLMRLFLGETAQDDLSFESWAARIDGASPAFIEELCRRTILIACDRIEGSNADSSISVNNEDMEQAMHELILTGGQLTANLLGFPSAS